MNKYLNILFTLLFYFISAYNTSAQSKSNLQHSDCNEKNVSKSKLDSLDAFLEKAGSSSLLILMDGKIVHEWGNTNKKHLIHSIRKTLLNSLYGIYIGNGTIDTTLTLKALKIDDIEPRLTEVEKSATIADLLKSRSGIYHNAAAVSEGMLKNKPKRGSRKPNEFYYYNNWDFNTLGFILEKLTNQSIYDLFYKHIAQPLRMDYSKNYITVEDPTEDWKIPDVDGFYQYESNNSRFPAYHFRLSSRDLALFGQLYLEKGIWEGKQIIPKSWIEASTKSYSVTNEYYGIGYGMLWNVLIAKENRPNKSFYHTGAGVHMLGVYPGSDLVLVHRVDTEKDYSFNKGDFYKMISLVWNSIQNNS